MWGALSDEKSGLYFSVVRYFQEERSYIMRYVVPQLLWGAITFEIKVFSAFCVNYGRNVFHSDEGLRA
jgi:hypothetical protein